MAAAIGSLVSSRSMWAVRREARISSQHRPRGGRDERESFAELALNSVADDAAGVGPTSVDIVVFGLGFWLND